MPRSQQATNVNLHATRNLVLYNGEEAIWSSNSHEDKENYITVWNLGYVDRYTGGKRKKRKCNLDNLNRAQKG